MTNSMEARLANSEWHKNRHWYNNGIDEKQLHECPEGWQKGRVHVYKQTDVSNKKRREWNFKYKTYKHFTLTDEQKQNLSNAKLRYYGGLR